MPTCSACSNPISNTDGVCPYCETPTGLAPVTESHIGASPLALSHRVSSVVTRYRDSYLVARATDGFGRMIKGIGIAASILLIACGVVFMAEAKGR
jgi:hypothetical protein